MNSFKHNDSFGKISLALMVTLLVGIGLVVIPATDSFVSDTKAFLLLFGAIAIALLYVTKAVIHKGFQLVSSPVLLPTLIFGLLVGLSAFVAKPYPVEELLGVGGSWLAWMIIILIGGALLPKNANKVITWALSGSAVGLTILSGLQLVGFGPAQALSQVIGTTIDSSLAFNLAGSPLLALQLLGIAGAGLVGSILVKRFKSPVQLVMLAIVVVGIVLNLWAIRPNGPSPVLLPSVTASWSVMLDSIRSPKTALIGSGPSSYNNMYRLYKPLFVNDTEQWSVVFNTATNTPLTLLSTVGILGFLAWALVTYQMLREVRHEWKHQLPTGLALLTTIVLFIFLPSNTLLIAIQAILFVALLAGSQSRQKFHLTALIDKVVLNPMNFGVEGMSNERKAPALPVYALAVVFAISLFLSLYGVGRAYYSLVLARQASIASVNNDALGLYNSQQEAVRTLPYLDILRRGYAITNLLIASGLAENQELTDEQREQISALLQQAVSEARAAVYLDPEDSANWQVLAQVYQNLIGVAEDAPQWTTQTYVSAIQTFPTDPQLRISLGGVLMNAEQYGEALGVFQQALQIKPDFANTYYNLAQALIGLERYTEAKQQYEVVLDLLDPTSEDFTRATQELEELQKIIDELPAQPEAPTETTEAETTTPTLLNQQLNTPAAQAVQQPGEQSLEELAPQAPTETEAENTPASDEQTP